ncbi:rRNA biogenesis protein rrp36 [Rhizophlyctis rosea]|nr:rRNA biogenesis protein rrp36 [Rhizophlyctis rosea]
MEANDEDDYDESDVEPMEIPRPASYEEEDEEQSLGEDDELGLEEDDDQLDSDSDDDTGSEDDEDYDDTNEYPAARSKKDDAATLERLKQELANVPFDQLLEIQRKVGLKTFHANYRGIKKGNAQDVGNGDDDSDEEESEDEDDDRPVRSKTDKKLGGKEQQKDEKKRFKKPTRTDKNMPTEVTSKRPVGRFREVIEVPKRKVRDPRFDPMAGHLNPDLVARSYGFLKEYEQSEMEMLKKQIKQEKNREEREKLEGILVRMTSRAQSRVIKDKRQQIMREHKKKEAEAVAKGKKPFYLKQSKIKELELKEKFDSLKAKGGDLDKFLEKRRRKNTSKEARYMPYKRRSA